MSAIWVIATPYLSSARGSPNNFSRMTVQKSEPLGISNAKHKQENSSVGYWWYHMNDRIAYIKCHSNLSMSACYPKIMKAALPCITFICADNSGALSEINGGHQCNIGIWKMWLRTRELIITHKLVGFQYMIHNFFHIQFHVFHLQFLYHECKVK